MAAKTLLPVSVRLNWFGFCWNTFYLFFCLEGLKDVIIYSSPDESKKKNRGFAFLEYESHKSASQAKRKLSSSRIKFWGRDILVDWADPIEEPDDGSMAMVG